MRPHPRAVFIAVGAVIAALLVLSMATRQQLAGDHRTITALTAQVEASKAQALQRDQAQATRDTQLSGALGGIESQLTELESQGKLTKDQVAALSGRLDALRPPAPVVVHVPGPTVIVTSPPQPAPASSTPTPSPVPARPCRFALPLLGCLSP